jgi:hypothetical protein
MAFPIPAFRRIKQMSITLKAAALALGMASLFGAGTANATVCDGTVQPTHMNRTYQCYYLPTVSNGRVTGLQKQVNYSGTPFAVGNGYRSHGRPTGGYYGPHHGGR